MNEFPQVDKPVEKTLDEAVAQLLKSLEYAKGFSNTRTYGVNEWDRLMEICEKHQKLVDSLVKHAAPTPSYREVDLPGSVVELSGFIPLGFQPTQIPTEESK